ncbi:MULTISPECIES: vWA domain-containing protein [Chryseobacterium]|uniref:Ca-activated chloride channel family protein n=1 Tax=Chryseobacterium rhizosphaerae TaxID=395937 RepID=A0AAE3YEG0_9FLAO|nr:MULTISPECIES: VWA domain-containing protein [Chryseobacterium]MDR6528854.1 Ca-activated chloride channel family protein [Chryseobacterium rhizosphaerae]SMC96404.1 Ca-activated chloride channel family protein [Chryseobacterium sp. YR221]
MENNHIDQQFNEASKLSEEPTVFPGFEKVWGKIEEKLDHKEEKKRTIPIWFPYGVAASLVIGLGALYFLNTKDASESVQQSIADISTSNESVASTNIAQIDSITKMNIQKDKNNAEPAVEKIAVHTDPVPGQPFDVAMPLPVPAPPIPSIPKIQVAANEYYVQNAKNIEVSDRRKGVYPPDGYYTQNKNAGEYTQPIEEVVLTAMGVKRSKASTASASSVITSNSIAPQTSVVSTLQGRVAGIQIGSSTNNQVNIKGAASVAPGKDPLYIVNGKIADADDFKALEPSKIENVAVLKDAAATALYGSKAANGIIVVTTKKLSRRERKRIEKLQEEINKQKQISPVANDESYDAFIENPFELTQSQPLSTFSIDVDNASYSNVRRMINNGEAVNKNAVRVEEMINYFTYGYPQPKNADPFSINTEYNKAPWNPDHQLLKIGLQGKNIPMDRLPASNLVFLIDVSGSMDEQNKLPLLKSSFKVLLNQLRPKDKVGIVVYAGSAGMVLPPTSAGEKDKIIQALDRLQAGGSTAGGEGIELAYKLAQENFVKDGNNRVIIATDGDFNVGESSTADLQTLIEEKRKSGVFLTCLGFGMGNYKDNTLETLADKGNGNYAYIDNMQEANKFLGREFEGSMYAIAKDVKIQIEFNPEFVKSYRLIGYENRKLRNEDFVNDKIDAGELGSGHTVTALYEIIPANVTSDFLPKESGLKYTQTISSKKFGEELATIKFRYKKPDEEKSQEISQVVKNSDRNISSASPDFKFASSVAWFGLVLRDSKLIKGKDLHAIESLAKEGKSKDEEGYRSEFIRLIEIYKTIQK